MKVERHNPGVSLRVSGATCDVLCRVVSRIPGVIITHRRQPFWWLSDGVAQFTFRGHAFTIEPDEWDGVYWILSKGWQKHEAEMQELRATVEKSTIPRIRIVDLLRRIFFGTTTEREARSSRHVNQSTYEWRQDAMNTHIWRYKDNQRNYPGYHLSADAEGCSALLAWLRSSKERPEFRLQSITAEVLGVPNNRAGSAAYVGCSSFKLNVKTAFDSSHFLFSEVSGRLSLECSQQQLDYIVRGVEDIARDVVTIVSAATISTCCGFGGIHANDAVTVE